MENQYLASCEVRWVLPKKFPEWIELHIDFKNRSILRGPTLVIHQGNPFPVQQQYGGNQGYGQVNNNSNGYYPPQNY